MKKFSRKTFKFSRLRNFEKSRLFWFFSSKRKVKQRFLLENPNQMNETIFVEPMQNSLILFLMFLKNIRAKILNLKWQKSEKKIVLNWKKDIFLTKNFFFRKIQFPWIFPFKLLPKENLNKEKNETRYLWLFYF